MFSNTVDTEFPKKLLLKISNAHIRRKTIL